jgi:hypothetical protein
MRGATAPLPPLRGARKRARTAAHQGKRRGWTEKPPTNSEWLCDVVFGRSAEKIESALTQPGPILLQKDFAHLTAQD